MRSFRLAGLLRLRTTQERQAAAELAAQNAERAAALTRTGAAHAQLGSHRMPAQASPAAFQASVAARVALVAGAQDALALLAAADERVAEAEMSWQRARLTAKTLEKLEEQHVTREKAAESHREQLVLDEHATTRGSRGPVDGAQ